MNKAVDRNFYLGQASGKIQHHMLIDRTLVDSGYKYRLYDLRMKVTDKSYSGDNRLNRHYSSY